MRHLTRAFALSLLAHAAIVTKVGAEPGAVPDGIETTEPVAISATAPRRQALIVGWSATQRQSSTRLAVSRADATQYRDLLKLLGFQVTTVFEETRPGLDLGVRGFAKKVSPDSEIAIFILGRVLPREDDFYLVSPKTSPSLDRYATDGLRVADLLQTVSAKTAKDTVVLIDECDEGAGRSCRNGAASLPYHLSAIVAVRGAPDASGPPLAGLSSLGGEMLPLMKREGLTYLDLYTTLQRVLVGSSLSVVSTPSLTRKFAFHPVDFLPRLDAPCNRVDPQASAQSLKERASVAPLVDACANAYRDWSFATFFKGKLAIVREQDLFQKAASGCDPATAQAYRQTYPGGRYIDALAEIEHACAPARRPPAASPPDEMPPNVAESSERCTVGGFDPAGNNWLALREQPSFQAPWTSTLMGPGTIVTTFGRAGRRVRVRLASGETGWANGKFLRCSRNR